MSVDARVGGFLLTLAGMSALLSLYLDVRPKWLIALVGVIFVLSGLCIWDPLFDDGKR